MLATSKADVEFRITHFPKTLEARKAVCEAGYTMELPAYVQEHSNDQWTVFTCTPLNNEYEKRYTQVMRNDGSIKWLIPHRDFIWSQRSHAILATYRWTRDGKYLYLCPKLFPNPSGFNTLHYFIRGCGILYRLNLDTGIFETTPPDNSEWISFALSPDDRYLIYTDSEKDNAVRIWDVEHKREAQFLQLDSKYILVGAYEWKPDSSLVVLAAAIDGWDTGKAGFSLFKITIQNMYLQIILQNDLRLFIPAWEGIIRKARWLDSDTLHLKSYAEFTRDSDWAINIQTGKIILIATPTPRVSSTATP